MSLYFYNRFPTTGFLGSKHWIVCLSHTSYVLEFWVLGMQFWIVHLFLWMSRPVLTNANKQTSQLEVVRKSRQKYRISKFQHFSVETLCASFDGLFKEHAFDELWLKRSGGRKCKSLYFASVMSVLEHEYLHKRRYISCVVFPFSYLTHLSSSVYSQSIHGINLVH